MTSKKSLLALLGFVYINRLNDSGEPYLNHSLLSPYLNIGLLHPAEVIAAVKELGDDIALNSIEGFIRQIIGWREYVHGLYWWFGPDYVNENHFNDDAPVPPSFTGAHTEMNCVAHVAKWVEQDAWTHHIPRLMVLANLATLAGIDPSKMMRWMWASFIDGAEWVMAPNVIGMGMYADGGRMSTKPYVSGGNYISKMVAHYLPDGVPSCCQALSSIKLRWL